MERLVGEVCDVAERLLDEYAPVELTWLALVHFG